MKKFLIAGIANLIVLIAIPFLIKLLPADTATQIIKSVIVFGNSIYFFFQMQMFSSKHKNPIILMVINIIFAIISIILFLEDTSVIHIFGGVYVLMMLLGSRVGSNFRKILELKKQHMN